jgi:tetratricopeptide (TPR) repeat protein
MYLEGTIAEARGDRKAAAARYRAVLAEDPDAAEAWARLGATQCLDARAEADTALARARALAPDLSEPFRATAECDLARGEFAPAATAAQAALARAPEDPDVSAVLVSALEHAGHVDEARRVRRALELLYGEAPEKSDSPSALREAVADGNLARVESAALSAHSPLADVDVAAIAAARPDLAEALATRALISDPGDVDAKVIVLLAADLGQKEDILVRQATSLPVDRTTPSDVSTRFMEELLARRVGDGAARAFHDALPAPGR